MASRRLLAMAALLGPMGVVGGCSLVNSFDDVKPLTADDDAGSDVGAHDTSLPDGTSDAGDGATDAASESASDAPLDVVTPVDADSGPLAPSGAIVMSATITPDSGPKSFFLTVIDPTNGHEIGTREAMNAVGIRYDGLRDVWYIFENKGVNASPLATDVVQLHVRTLDTHTGAWTELQKLSVPPIVNNGGIAVLRDRLAYVGYTLSDAGVPGFQLAVLDTSVASAVAFHSGLTLQSPPGAMTGTRSPSGAGGSVNLAYEDTTACQGDGGATDPCQVTAIHVSVQASSAPVIVPPTKTLGVALRFGSGVAGASWLGGGPDDIYAFPSSQGSPAYIEHFSSFAADLGQKVTFPMTGPLPVGLVIAECWNMAFVADLKIDQVLYGIPLNGGTVLAKSTGHINQWLAFEPYTSTALVAFSSGGAHELTAFAVTGSPSAPAMAKRSSGWTPPADLEPVFVTTKQPIPFACP